MPWSEVPHFYASLDERSQTDLAMRLLILTGVRSGALRHLQLEQLAGDVWTVPADNMKGLRGKTQDFRLPLSSEARRVIDLAKPFERGGFLFPSPRKGVISDMTLARMMERRGLEARPHGFRTSLRTWLAEATDAPHEVAEAVLAHVTGSSVERAYRRTDFLEQRRLIMQRWADFVTGRSGLLMKLRA
jgi:integrase